MGCLALLAMLAACTPQTFSDTAIASECKPGRLGTTSHAGLALARLCLESRNKVHQFDVEIAATSAQQTQGLMFRTELADDRGMVFPFATDRFASFWMRNTPIPLDIIFVRRDGTIESIAAQTIPYSLEPVGSGEPVGLVLEIRGGLANELGISPGDRVTWR